MRMHMMAKWQFRSLAFNTMSSNSLVWILLQIYSVASTITIPDLIGPKCYVKESDINIGVITQVYEKGTGELYCGRQLQNSRVLQVIEAVVWAIDEINKDDTILPDADLGYVILDDCGKEITATAQAMAFVKESQDGLKNQSANRTNNCQARQFDVVGVLGLEDSEIAQSVSNIMALFSIPVLSTLGRSRKVTSQYEEEHDYLFYMTPPDQLQGKAMVDLMKHFGWTYSALIYSEGTYGEQGADYIQRLLEPNDTCVALVKRLRANAKLEDFEQIFDELDKIQRARAVLLFLSEEHVKRFFEIVAKYEVQNRYIWIGSNTITSLSGPEVSGAFSIIANETVSGDFSAHYSSLTPDNSPNNPWIKELWESLYNCSWQSSDPQLSCKNQSVPFVKQEILTETSRYIDAVYVLARALHKYIDTLCLLTTLSECLNGQGLQSTIKSINFTGQTGHIQFGADGNIQNGFLLKYYNSRTTRWLTLGHWSDSDDTIHVDDDLIDWHSYTGFRLSDNPGNTVPLSVCSLNCTVKEHKLQGASTCCWECKRCKGNEIIIHNSACQGCPFGMWPDESTSKICETIESTYFDWGDPKAIPLWFCSIIGMIGCVFIGVFFFIKRKNKLIGASNFELSAITLAGAFLSYMTMLVMIGKPNAGRCAMERFGFDNALAILVVPLMVKVNRSFRIYQASKKGNKDVVFIGRASQLAFCIGVLLMQIILATLSMVVVPPEAKSRMPNPTTERLLELHCHMPITGIILPLLFNLVMVLLCGYFGFSVFKLPDNFYESRCICISACLTWILWLCFMPIYFSAKYQVNKVISLEVCLLFNATLVIFIIFLPKLYAAYFVKDEDLKLTVNVIKTRPSQEISGLSARRPSGTDSRRASGNHLQVGSPVAGSLNGGEHGHDENAILAAYVAKSGRRRSSTIRAIRKMDINKIAAVKETETPNATTSGT